MSHSNSTRSTLGVLVACVVVIVSYIVRLSSSHSPLTDPFAADAQSTSLVPNEVSRLDGDASRSTTISFVHFNDFHAHYQPKDYGDQVVSPLSLIRGYYDQVKAENPHTLFCSAGDEMEKGSLVEVVSHGVSTIEIYKHLGLDLRAIGNHDFGYGLETLRRFVTEPGDVALCANQSMGTNYHQRTVAGVRIGVFSMVCQPWDERDEQYSGAYFNGVNHRYDFVEVAQEIVRAHRRDVDLLFMLSHAGIETDRDVAAKVPGLDFIIGGHSHELLSQAERTRRGVVIVQAGSFGEFVGRLDIQVDAHDHKMRSYRYGVKAVHPANMTANASLETAIREICHRLGPDVDTPLMQIDSELRRSEVARLAGQCAMEVLKVSAAVMDTTTVWGRLQAGLRSRQDFLDCFRMEIQPAGTHGFNSLVSATIRKSDWDLMRRDTSNRFVFVGDPVADPAGNLRVAIQRRTALRLQNFFRGVSAPTAIQFEMEVWEAMSRYATNHPAVARPAERRSP